LNSSGAANRKEIFFYNLTPQNTFKNYFPNVAPTDPFPNPKIINFGSALPQKAFM
jgi:hypothetical protein